MGKFPPREQLINTAIELFHEHGYHATGVDKIIEKAGVCLSMSSVSIPKKTRQFEIFASNLSV
jgi:hypothetical protein